MEYGRQIDEEEIDFYLKETEVSSIQKALLQISLPHIELSKLSKREIIIKLILLKDFLIKNNFKVLSVFVLCTIEGLDKIHKNKKKSLGDILTEELNAPIRVISYEYKQTKESGDMFVDRHRIELVAEMKYYINAMNEVYNKEEE